MDDDEYSIPRHLIDEAEGNRGGILPECISCGQELPDDEMKKELPVCPVCGAGQVSDAAGDWLDTELGTGNQYDGGHSMGQNAGSAGLGGRVRMGPRR